MITGSATSASKIVRLKVFSTFHIHQKLDFNKNEYTKCGKRGLQSPSFKIYTLKQYIIFHNEIYCK